MQDLTGKKFGKLTVLKLEYKKAVVLKNGRKNGYVYFYLCECECGNKKIIQNTSLISGGTRSCGCITKARAKILGLNSKTHGKTKTRLYKIWLKIKERCNNPNSNRFNCYGQRGIKISKKWENDFLNFEKWALANGYQNNLTIDRIDNNKNYEPGNCRWVTQKTQQNNRRSNLNITYKNQTQTLAKWSEQLNINYDKLRQRILKLNWSIEKAFNTP